MDAFTHIEFSPLIPWELLIGLAAVTVLLLAFAVWRRAQGVGWRTLALVGALAALANPSLVEEQRTALRDVALVVVDDSLSQDVGDRRERTEQALTAIRERLDRDDSVDLRVVRAGTTANGGDMPNGTRLVTAMDRALVDIARERLAGVVLLTDGQVHDAPAKAEADAAEAVPGAPVHVLLTGSRNERDRRLNVVEAPRYGIVDEMLELNVVVEDQGGEAGETTIILRQDGDPTRTFRAAVGAAQRIPFTLNHAGPTVLELETPAGPGELTLRNNRAVLLVNGVRERLRVLLVSGEPHAGERTWRNILKSDPSVDLVHFTILRPPQKQDGTPIRELSLISFPTRELFQTKLHEFDLVIFDRYRRRGVLPDSYLANVARYVRGGGAVLIAAGPAYSSPFSLDRTPLSEVLPSRPTGRVHSAGYRPVLTDPGFRHPVTSDLPGVNDLDQPPTWGRWFRLIDVDHARGDILMHGPASRPLLILDRVGEGRVAQLLSDHAWLWARGYEGGGPQAELLRRISHWLMKEPDLEEEDLRALSDSGRLTVRRRSLTPEAGRVTITTPSGQEIELELSDNGRGQESGSIAVSEPGLYRLSDGERQTIAAVGDVNPLEYADMRTTPEKLEPLATASNGSVFWLADRMPEIRRIKPDRDTSGRNWLGLRANQDYVVAGVTQYPLLPAILVLFLFVGITMYAWRREGG